MTKTAQTTKERKERYEANQAALKNDRVRELEVLREIRDSDRAMPRDRIEAIRLLREITAQGR